MVALAYLLFTGAALAGRTDFMSVVHVSDLHFDPLYLANSSPSTFCRSGSGSAGKFGTRSGCDSPLALVDAVPIAITALIDRALLPGYKRSSVYMYWTGDDYTHNPIDLDGLVKAVNVTTTALLRTGLPGRNIVPTLGNHNFVPPDLARGNMPVYQRISEVWVALGVMTEAEKGVFVRAGYFSRLIEGDQGQLLVISLNTVLWYMYNPYAQGGTEDYGQMDFLASELSSAMIDRVPVHIVCHVPPGYHSQRGEQHLVDSFNNRFLDLLEENQDIVKAVFAGHEHMDTARVIARRRGVDGFSLLRVFVAPSITANAGSGPAFNNPAVRLYRIQTSVHHTSPSAITFAQDFVPLEEANTLGQAVFRKEYNASEAYGFSEDGSLKDWIALMGNLSVPGSSAWTSYAVHKFVMSQASPTMCTGACVATTVCASVCGWYDGSFASCEKDPSAWIQALLNPSPPSPRPTPTRQPSASATATPSTSSSPTASQQPPHNKSPNRTTKVAAAVTVVLILVALVAGLAAFHLKRQKGSLQRQAAAGFQPLDS
jgi:hypothetical protein